MNVGRVNKDYTISVGQLLEMTPKLVDIIGLIILYHKYKDALY